MTHNDKRNLQLASTIMNEDEKWNLHTALYGPTDGAIGLLGTLFHFGNCHTQVPFTKSMLMSISQVTQRDDSEVQPTKVVSIFHLFVFNVSYIYSQ